MSHTRPSGNTDPGTLKSTLKRLKGVDTSSSEMALEIVEDRITDTHDISQALTVEHTFRKSIEKAIPCGIMGFDSEGRQIYVNHVFSHMTGWEERTLLGRSWPFIYWPPDIVGQYPETFHTFRHKEASFMDMELPFKCKDGSFFWGLISSAFIYNSDGEKNGIIVSVTDITRRKTAETRLRVLSARLIDAQEKERQTAAQDIHDSLCGKLTGIKYSLENILSSPPSDLEGAMENIIQVIKGAIDETQRISGHLRPSVLDDLGILAAIRDLIREFKSLYAPMVFSLSLHIDEAVIPQSIPILIYRVIQEALNNACRHSRATRVTISLSRKASRVVLKVTDNGRGFDATNMQITGMGISGMMERTELFDGRFRLHSLPGKGTTVEASWPMIPDKLS